MANFPEHFERQYQLHLKHLKLKGLRPKTIDAHARGMRRIGEYFSYQVDRALGPSIGDDAVYKAHLSVQRNTCLRRPHKGSRHPEWYRRRAAG